MVSREEAVQLLVSQAPHFQLTEVEVSGIPMRVYLRAALPWVPAGVHRDVW